MTEDPRIPKLSDGELAFRRRTTRHFGLSLKAFGIPLALSAIVLASGNYLSTLIDVDPSSILFQLWPYNHVYLRQFTSSSYDHAEIKWFFTVVSCSNAVWLAFLCWKIFFELFRTDVQFPRTSSLTLIKSILAFFISGFVIVALGSVVTLAGFSKEGYGGFEVIALNRPIGAGAFKIVMIEMGGLYFGICLILEFGGLGLRYLLSRTFGCFVAD